MKTYVDDTIFKLKIIKQKYIIIHIRSGDDYLKNDTKIFNTQYFNILTNEIFKINLILILFIF
jgi:hypothetical protein